MWDETETYDKKLLKSRAKTSIPHAPVLGYHQCAYIANCTNIRCNQRIQIDLNSPNYNSYYSSEGQNELLSRLDEDGVDVNADVFCDLHKSDQATQINCNSDLLNFEICKVDRINSNSQNSTSSIIDKLKPSTEINQESFKNLISIQEKRYENHFTKIGTGKYKSLECGGFDSEPGGFSSSKESSETSGSDDEKENLDDSVVKKQDLTSEDEFSDMSTNNDSLLTDIKTKATKKDPAQDSNRKNKTKTFSPKLFLDYMKALQIESYFSSRHSFPISLKTYLDNIVDYNTITKLVEINRNFQNINCDDGKSDLEIKSEIRKAKHLRALLKRTVLDKKEMIQNEFYENKDKNFYVELSHQVKKIKRNKLDINSASPYVRAVYKGSSKKSAGQEEIENDMESTLFSPEQIYQTGPPMKLKKCCSKGNLVLPFCSHCLECIEKDNLQKMYINLEKKILMKFADNQLNSDAGCFKPKAWMKSILTGSEFKINNKQRFFDKSVDESFTDLFSKCKLRQGFPTIMTDTASNISLPRSDHSDLEMDSDELEVLQDDLDLAPKKRRLDFGTKKSNPKIKIEFTTQESAAQVDFIDEPDHEHAFDQDDINQTLLFSDEDSKDRSIISESRLRHKSEGSDLELTEALINDDSNSTFKQPDSLISGKSVGGRSKNRDLDISLPLFKLGRDKDNQRSLITSPISDLDIGTGFTTGRCKERYRSETPNSGLSDISSSVCSTSVHNFNKPTLVKFGQDKIDLNNEDSPNTIQQIIITELEPELAKFAMHEKFTPTKISSQRYRQSNNTEVHLLRPGEHSQSHPSMHNYQVHATSGVHHIGQYLHQGYGPGNPSHSHYEHNNFNYSRGFIHHSNGGPGSYVGSHTSSLYDRDDTKLSMSSRKRKSKNPEPYSPVSSPSPVNDKFVGSKGSSNKERTKLSNVFHDEMLETRRQVARQQEIVKAKKLKNKERLKARQAILDLPVRSLAVRIKGSFICTIDTIVYVLTKNKN